MKTAALIALIDLSTPAGVMLYSVYNGTWGVLLYLGYFLYRMARLRPRPPKDNPP